MARAKTPTPAKAKEVEQEEILETTKEEEVEVETPTPAKAKEVVEMPVQVLDLPRQNLAAKGRLMQAKLAEEPRVPILYPLSDGEQPGTLLSVNLNSYQMYVPKGVLVNVPVSVADVVAAKLKQSQFAKEPS